MPENAPSLYFIGTATTLIRYGDLTLLTDPNFLHQGERAYLGYGLTSKRLTSPALSPGELPPLDAILLSHLHGDHWDRRAERSLDHDLPVLTTPHAARRLQWRGFSRALGLRTWTSHEIVAGTTKVRVTAVPGRHAPGVLQHLLPPVMGSVVEFGPVSGPVLLRLYVSGDTLMVDELREIPHRFSDIHAAVLHLGGTRLPGGLMVTMDGQHGADLMELVDAGIAIPIHYDDYTRFRSPLADFRREVERRGLLSRVRFVDRGQTVDLTADETARAAVPAEEGSR